MEPISATRITVPLPQSPAVSYPLRFIGSKSDSLYAFTARLLTGRIPEAKGYYFTPQHDLTSQEVKSYIKYAVLAHIVPSSRNLPLADWVGYEVVSPNELQLDLTTLPGSLHANHERIFDKTTGLKVMVFSNETEVVIGFGPAGSYQEEIRDTYESLKLGSYIWCCGVMANLAGIIPYIYTQADALVTALLQMPSFNDKNIMIVGHSIGGSLASYVALKHQIRAIGFNSLPLGAGLQKDIGEDKLALAERFVTHLSVSGDIPSDCPLVHYVDRCISFAGIKTPGNFGNHYRIPSTRCGQTAIHNEYLLALIDHVSLGHSGSLQEVLTFI